MRKNNQSTQIYFEDVSIGMKLPVLVKRPNEVQLFMYAAAIWDTHRTHWDIPYATATEKLPGILVVGHHQAAFLGQLVTDWIGFHGKLLSLNYRNQSMAIAGDVLHCRGTVKEIKDEGNNSVLVADLWIENQRKEITTTGEATIRLPRRNV